jgi:hypothetical protein
MARVLLIGVVIIALSPSLPEMRLQIRLAPGALRVQRSGANESLPPVRSGRVTRLMGSVR